MITPVETLRANMAHLERMALAYADALVAHAQAGDADARTALDACLSAHERLTDAARTVANTL